MNNDLPSIGEPARRALESIGVVRLGQVAERTRPELAAVHGVGPKAISLLETALAASGRTFRSH